MKRILVIMAALVLAPMVPLAAQVQRIADVTTHEGEVPVRLVGYGLVFGLEGTGDRNLGYSYGQTPTVRSIANVLRRFGVVVPAERMRPRNVAAVMVTAEFSPYLRPGGRFEVQVASLGDATSLRGGVLYITPMVAGPGQDPVATSQGPLMVTTQGAGYEYSSRRRSGTSGRIPDGGVVEVDLPGVARNTASRLLLRHPDLAMASRIAQSINLSLGEGTATVADAGLVTLNPGGQAADNMMGFLAAVDTLTVQTVSLARIFIDGRDGTVVAGGEVRVGPAAVTHRGITVQVGGTPAPPGSTIPGLVSLGSGATAQDVAAGLHAVGAGPREVAAIFDALRTVGALTAEVVVR